MDLLFGFLAFLFRVFLASVTIWFVHSRFLVHALQSASVLSPLWYPVFGLSAALVWDNAIYALCLDPLRKLPTVWITDHRELLPITIVPRGAKALKWIQTYPNADIINIRIFPGSQALMLVSPQAFRDVFSAKMGDFVKPQAGRDFLASSLGSHGLILLEGEGHKAARKAITPSFRIQNIKSLQPLIAAKTTLMLQRIQESMKTDGKIEIASWGSRATMDIIGPALMSRDFRSLTTQDSPLEHAYAELIAPSRAAAFLFELSMLLPQWFVKNLPLEQNAKANRACALIRQTCTEILDEKIAALREAKDTARDRFDVDRATADILGSIMRHGNLPKEDLIDQMMTFLGAGHETTASSIAWATHLLTLPQYLHYQSELRAEVRAAMDEAAQDATTDPNEGFLSYSTLESLPLLNGICEETLRLFPPVTNTGRNTTRPTVVAGTLIPAGTMIVLSAWAVNRNPAYWGANADAFVPERWVDGLPDGTRRFNHHGGAPSNLCEMTFLHGSRSCIGRDLAKAELRYMVAAIWGGFETTRLPGDDGSVVPAGSLTIKPKDGLWVRMVPA